MAIVLLMSALKQGTKSTKPSKTSVFPSPKVKWKRWVSVGSDLVPQAVPQ